jgi:hypothetical protein
LLRRGRSGHHDPPDVAAGDPPDDPPVTVSEPDDDPDDDRDEDPDPDDPGFDPDDEDPDDEWCWPAGSTAPTATAPVTLAAATPTVTLRSLASPCCLAPWEWADARPEFIGLRTFLLPVTQQASPQDLTWASAVLLHFF